MRSTATSTDCWITSSVTIDQGPCSRPANSPWFANLDRSLRRPGDVCGPCSLNVTHRKTRPRRVVQLITEQSQGPTPQGPPLGAPPDLPPTESERVDVRHAESWSVLRPMTNRQGGRARIHDRRPFSRLSSSPNPTNFRANALMHQPGRFPSGGFPRRVPPMSAFPGGEHRGEIANPERKAFAPNISPPPRTTSCSPSGYDLAPHRNSVVHPCTS